MATTSDGRRASQGPGPALLQRRLTLSPTPESAGRARRAVRDAVLASDGHRWLEDAELAVSEVVTNVVLHAHTDIEVAIEVFTESVCVEVRDFDETLPVQRDYGGDGTTGRGMRLLRALTPRCGVHSLGEAGKVVWFCVSDEEVQSSPDDVAVLWADAVAEDGHQRPTCQIVLADLPTTLWLSAREHHDAMIRELGYYLAASPGVDVDIAAADKARSTISATLAAVLAEADTAGATRPVLPWGQPSRQRWVPERLDLTVTVPADGATMFAAMREVLDVGESLAVEGKLLLVPGLPEIVAVRNWVCDEVAAQLAGRSPTPWAGIAHERFETEVRVQTTRPGSWDPTTVTDADRPAVAADDANRIIAVNRLLAEDLGWDPDDLVGRRVVTIVPPALREAHVAGFSRHLSTGEAHALGVPLELPVLAADGREVMFRFVIEQVSAKPGPAVYVAWMERI